MRRAKLAVDVVDLDPAVNDDAVHEAQCRVALSAAHHLPILGGFSLGARIAVQVSLELVPRGLLLFGFPFHVAKHPEQQHGLGALSQVALPTCIIQGTRDVHGTEAEVRSYRLPSCAEVVWLRDGNHRFQPRRRSGETVEGHLRTAAAAAIEFIEGLCTLRHGSS